MHLFTLIFALPFLVGSLAEDGKKGTIFGKACDNGVCQRAEDKGPCIDDRNPKLFRWEPIRKGYSRTLELEPGKKYTMTTVASKPPIFEIRNFLSSKECEYLKKLAKKNKFFVSHTHLDEGLLKHKQNVTGHAEGVASYIQSWDKNMDNEITKDEIMHFALTYKYLYMSEDEVQDMIKRLDLKQFSDGKITTKEFETFPTASIDSYMNYIKEYHPKHKDRYSSQTWIEQGKTGDPVVLKLTERIIKLTRLSRTIVRGGEALQVVRYEKNGHYNGHFDSQAKSKYKCCQKDYAEPPMCRLCRYATVLYYLNDVKDGGETAFPAADIENYTGESDLIKNVSGDVFNLMQNCHKAKLVVPAEKGKAILWYNHFVDEETGLLGERDDYTVHGGCGVTKGYKWLANNWITAPDVDNLDMLKAFKTS